MDVPVDTQKQRVFLTLLGHADNSGYVSRFAREEVLAYARVTISEFERALTELESEGRVEVHSNGGPRKFVIHDRQQRGEALRYLNSQKARVQAVIRERDRLDRVQTEGWSDVVLCDIVREETSSGKIRWRFAVTVPDIGTIRDCSYYEGSRVLYGPSRYSKTSASSETLVEFQGHLRSQITDAIVRHITATGGIDAGI